jgi:hypothetical protein
MERRSRISLVVLVVLVAACDTNNKTPAQSGAETIAGATRSTTATAASTASATVANPPPVDKAKVKVGDSVEVCWRHTPATQPFAKHDTPFQCPASFAASKAPWGDGEGGVNGAMLIAVLRTAVPGLDPAQVRLRAPTPSKDPREPGSTCDVNDSQSQYYNNWVGVDAAGKLRVYVDVVGP